MDNIKDFEEINDKKISLPTDKLFFPNFLKLITSIFIFLILFANLLLLTSCEDEVTQSPPKPPGYQEDIPWPSLADSPWPMNHHDPQNTGRCNFIGPILGTIDWTLDAGYVQSGISIGPNNMIFLDKDYSLTSVSTDGLINWQYGVGGFILSTTLIDKDNRIYFCTSNHLYCLSTDGSFNWSFETEGNLESMMNIGIDGIIYILDKSSKLYALSSSGELLWSHYDQNFNLALGGISFSPSGKTLYLTGKNNDIIAFDIINKTIKWTFDQGAQYNSPIIDSQGNIYYLKSENANNPGYGTLSCIDECGIIKWKYDFNFPANTGLFYSNTPTIDKNGNVYFAYDTLYSLDYSGNLRWKKSLIGYSDCPLICDGNSDIYVGIMNVNNNGQQIAIAKYTDKGLLSWELRLDQSQVGGSPALGNGKLIFPSWRSSKIYSIK